MNQQDPSGFSQMLQRIRFVDLVDAAFCIRPASALHRNGLAIADREDVDDPEEILSDASVRIPLLHYLDQLAGFAKMR
jgi:hypothetical protein